MSMSHSPESTTDADPMAAEDRPRKSRGVVALLALLTLANVVVLLLTVNAWVDATTHGDEYAGLLAFSIMTTVVGLVGLGGAWATRKWGPWLYLAAIVVDHLVVLVALPRDFPPAAIVGVVVAVVLVARSRAW